MSEFVYHTGGISAGRLHSFPETRGGGNALLAFARNFAHGPASTTDIETSGTQVPWSGIDVGAPGVDVPITPRATGVVMIRGVLNIKSLSGVQENLIVQVVVNGLPLLVPFLEQPTIEPAVSSGGTVIAILTEVNAVTFGSLLPLGVVANVQIILTSGTNDTLQVTLDSSSLELQEMPVSTG